jgi:predicted lipoprotein with Yx(FWY)xxD motif
METSSMKNYFSTFWILFVSSFLTTGILLSGQNLARANEIVGVKIMEKELVGNYLADGKGITLYSFARDGKNISNCIEGCAVNWPPFYVVPTAVIEGCESSDFAAITRTDGRHQTTYKGMPLYYFKNDKYPGDTFGHGIGDVWFLVTP